MPQTPAQRRAYYLANKQRSAEINKASRTRALRLVNDFKSRPCMDCGESYPYWVMDLDHRDPSQKIGNISKLIMKEGWRNLAKIQRELDKCDVVCANCHRQRHPPERCREEALARLAL